MGTKDKQSTVIQLTEESKSILRLVSSGASSASGVQISVTKAVTCGVKHLDLSATSPAFKGFKWFIVTDPDEITALVNRTPLSNKDRHIFVDGDYNHSIDLIHSMLDGEWVITDGRMVGHSFSFSGEEGKGKVVFSYTLDYLISKYYDIEFFGQQRSKYCSINLEKKGKYLLDGDIIHLIMCEGYRSDCDKDGAKLHFTTSDLVLNVTKGRGYKTSGSDITIWKDGPILDRFKQYNIPTPQKDVKVEEYEYELER
jgi:hypothetical protein